MSAASAGPATSSASKADDATMALETALGAIERWGADFTAAVASGPGGVLASHGDPRKVVRIASLTKLTTAWAVLLGTEEGAVSLEDPVGPPGCTVAHLLAHAGGLDFDSIRVLASPGTRRIYSNTGYEMLARHLETATSIPFVEYLEEGVLSPLGMTSTELRGSAAKDLHSNAADLVRFAEEIRSPRLLAPTTAQKAKQVQFPGLAGVVPGWGRYDPCDWSYGPELHGAKSPHWMGETAQADTLGHFGGSGTLMWLDQTTGLGCIALGDRPFGDWSVGLWPPFSDGVRSAARDLL